MFSLVVVLLVKILLIKVAVRIKVRDHAVTIEHNVIIAYYEELNILLEANQWIKIAFVIDTKLKEFYETDDSIYSL